VPGEVYGFEHGAARRWAELVNRLFGMESADAPLPPGFILELERPEWAFLKNELLWTTGPQVVAAGVGNVSRMQVQNPAGSGRLVVVQRVHIRGPAVATVYTLAFDATIIVSGLQRNVCRDTRRPLSAGTRNNCGSVNAIANNLPGLSGNFLDRVQAQANGPDVEMLGPWVLAPGTLIEVSNSTQNQGETFLMYGYEHVITPDELAA